MITKLGNTLVHNSPDMQHLLHDPNARASWKDLPLWMKNSVRSAKAQHNQGQFSSFPTNSGWKYFDWNDIPEMT